MIGTPITSRTTPVIRRTDLRHGCETEQIRRHELPVSGVNKTHYSDEMSTSIGKVKG